MGRHGSGSRCVDCLLNTQYCVCAEAEKLREAHAPFLTALKIVRHTRELSLTTNTAHLLKLLKPDTEIFDYGKKGSPLDWSAIISSQKSQANLILFPFSEATLPVVPLSAVAQNFGQNYTLWVSDGNWRQGAKIANRMRQNLPNSYSVVVENKVARYRLRKSSHASKLSTFEAVAHALGEIHQAPDATIAWLAWFDQRVEGALKSRGQINNFDR